MSRPAQPIRLPSVPGPKSSLADRVRWLLDDYWKGNRKKCADDIGVNPTYISRIATETNNPGTDLLEKLAEKSFINTRWLLTGSGTPYLSPEQQLPASWALPVVSELPAGQIQQPSSLLARHYKEIDFSNYSTSRCWTQLAMSDNLAHRGEYGFQVGDYLLWETNPTYWKDLSILYHRPAIILEKGSNQPRIKVLDYIEPEDDAPYVNCDDLSRPKSDQSVSTRQYLLTVSKDNQIEMIPVTKHKRLKMQIPDLLHVQDRRRIVAVAVLRCGAY